jgi:hypothetical protein
MGYQFERLETGEIGKPKDGSSVARFELSFRDTESRHRPLVTLELCVPADGSATVAELEAVAFERAKILLSEATNVMHARTLASIKTVTTPHD